MIYLEKSDLTSIAFERLIDESTKDRDVMDEGENPEVIANQALDQIEAQNIELLKSYIGSRYDVGLIFNPGEPVRNQLLVRILTNLVLYDVFRRNAARKVPTDTVENYEKAMELLEKIATGRLPVDGLPPKTDDDGNPVSTSIWGNNRNDRYYI